jgi:mono/diheme cytochrome c family protein
MDQCAIRRIALLIGIVVAGIHVAAPAAAQSTGGASGQSTFTLYCATCHGTSAKGDGPLATMLTKRPADLTQIARRSGGTFSPEMVARIIDGRKPIRGHGGGEMPIWGDAFAKSADPLPVDEKIRRLVVYIESLQVKP